MRKILLAAAGFAVLAGGAGLAIAQNAASNAGEDRPGRHDIFQADANNDGVLTRQEFDAGRNAMFARQDANNDGQLARDEMHRGGHGGHHRGGRDGGMHSLASADANNDGNITRDEFLARPLEHFNRMDANHDGVIDAAELAAIQQRMEARRAERPDAGKGAGGGGWAAMDADHDGKITEAEALAAAKARFAALDADKDGVLSPAEQPARRGPPN